MDFMNNIILNIYKVLFMKSMNNLKKLAAGIPGLAAGIPGLAAEIPGKLFSVSEMFGISLPSRAFSSESLMVGENLVASQVFDSVSDADMLAELRYLEDFMVIRPFFYTKDLFFKCLVVILIFSTVGPHIMHQFVHYSNTVHVLINTSNGHEFIFSPQDLKKTIETRPVATPARGVEPDQSLDASHLKSKMFKSKGFIIQEPFAICLADPH